MEFPVGPRRCRAHLYERRIYPPFNPLVGDNFNFMPVEIQIDFKTRSDGRSRTVMLASMLECSIGSHQIYKMA